MEIWFYFKLTYSFVALWVRLRLWGAQNSQGKKTQHISSIVHKLYHFNCLSLDEVNANIQSGMSILWCKLSGNVKLQFNLFEGPPYLPESRTRSQMKWQRGVGRGRKTTGVQETNWRWGGKHWLQRGRAGVSPPQNYRKGWLELTLSSPCSEKMLLQPVKRNFMCSIFATIPPEWTQKAIYNPQIQISLWIYRMI